MASWVQVSFYGRMSNHLAWLSLSEPGEKPAMEFILWLIAVVLVVWGIVTAVRGAVLQGILLIVLGLLVGPGGVSLFT